MSVTLKDIAHKVGYSVTTVSRALNDYDDVSEETKQLIKRVAQEMGYHPHVIAQSLQRRRTNTVGFIVPATERYLSDPYFLELLAGIGDGAASYDFDLLISTCKPMDSKERVVYERMVQGRRVDGIVVARTRCDDERIAYYDIGKMLSQMLIKIIKGEELAQRQIILQPELVVRESSGVG